MERVGWTLVTLMVHWPSDCDTLTALTITHLRRTVAQVSINVLSAQLADIIDAMYDARVNYPSSPLPRSASSGAGE